MGAVSFRFIAAAIAAFGLDAALAFHPAAAAERLWAWLAAAFAVMIADGVLGEAERWRQRLGGMEGDWGGAPAAVWLIAVFLLWVAEAWAQDKPVHGFFPPKNILLLALETAALLVLASFSKALADVPPRRPRPRPVPTPPKPHPAPGPIPPPPAPEPTPRDRKDAIVDYCRAHGGRISASECAKILGVSRRYARIVLRGLVRDGVLTQSGKRGDSDAHYSLPDANSGA